MQLKLEITGNEELQTKLGQLSRAVRTEALLKGALAAADVVQDAAYERAPKRTGKAARSITSEVTVHEAEKATVAVGPGKEGWYLRFHELGTRYMPARPWLRPALDESESEAKRVARKAMREVIEGAVR